MISRLAIELEILQIELPNGFRIYDFGGGNAIMPVPNANRSGWLTSKMFGIEDSSNGHVVMVEVGMNEVGMNEEDIQPKVDAAIEKLRKEQ